jgi:hypothetical protein
MCPNLDIIQQNAILDAGTLTNLNVLSDGDVGADEGIRVDLGCGMYADISFGYCHILRLGQNAGIKLRVIVQVLPLRKNELFRFLYFLPETVFERIDPGDALVAQREEHVRKRQCRCEICLLNIVCILFVMLVYLVEVCLLVLY